MLLIIITIIVVVIVVGVLHARYWTTKKVVEPEIQPQVLVSEENVTLEGDSDKWVKEHNRIRKSVGLEPVGWNIDLANRASEYSKMCNFSHSLNSDRKYGDVTLGENIAQGAPYEVYDIDKMVNLWERESEFYKYPDTPTIIGANQTGHYTQIINKNVKEIGCGCSRCGENSKLCVCQYNKIQEGNKPPY